MHEHQNFDYFTLIKYLESATTSHPGSDNANAAQSRSHVVRKLLQITSTKKISISRVPPSGEELRNEVAYSQ